MNENKRDRMLGVAEELAEQLLTLSGVAQVALFGSVARAEENPSDIDLFVLTEEESIPLSILEKAERSGTWVYPLNCTKTLNILRAPNSFWRMFFRMKWGVEVSIIVMPVEPTSEFLDRFYWANFDEDFLENTARDFQIFDPASGHFQKAEAPWVDYVAEYEVGEEWYNGDEWDASLSARSVLPRREGSN